MKRLLLGVATLALLLSVVEGALAFGKKGQASGATESGTMFASCPAPCYMPAPTVSYSYQTEYRQVQRTVCETVPVTTTVDTTECYTEAVTSKQKETYYESVPKTMKGKHTVYRPATEKQKETYYEQVSKTMKGKHTVYRPATEKQKSTYYVSVPKTSKVEQSYYVCVPVTRTVQQAYTVAVPEVRQETRQAVSTVCETVPYTENRQVVSYVPQVVASCAPAPCGGCASSCAPAPSCSVRYVPTVSTVSSTSYLSVPRQVVQNYTVNVCSYRNETRTQNVSYVENTTQIQKQMVDVTTYVSEARETTVDVVVMKPVEEEYTYVVCEMQPRERTVDVVVMRPAEEEYTYTVYESQARERTVDVVSYVTKTRVVKTPVTSYTTVSRVVTESVPVTVCVPVISAPAPACPAPSVVVPSPTCY